MKLEAVRLPALLVLPADLSTPAYGSSSVVPPGWRDLGISQYRRIKGDAQLDQTYAMSAAAAAVAAEPSSIPAVPPPDQQYNTGPWTWPSWDSSCSATNPIDPSSTTVPPHHISNEPMSELSYAIYMARRLPVELLVSLVRRSFRPEEYPRSVEGLYHSSPDEAIPQFYTDPQVGCWGTKQTHLTVSSVAVECLTDVMTEDVQLMMLLDDVREMIGSNSVAV